MRAYSVLLLSVALASATSVPARGRSLSEIFKKVDPAVVVVHTNEKEIAPVSGAQPVSVAGMGSGVLLSTDGKVLTAAHLVQTADAVEVGDPVFVVGAPLGMSHTLAVGHISARRGADAASGGMGLAEFFQTDAAINQGDSGSPLFNMAGEVIGVVSHILSQSGGSDGLGFAVTSNVVRRFVLEERSFWSGLSGALISGELAQVLNLPPPGAGLLVQRIASGSPAERIGLRAGTVRATIGDEDLIVGGDIILAVGGIPLAGPNGVLLARRRIEELPGGERLAVTVLRAGMTLDLTGTTEP